MNHNEKSLEITSIKLHQLLQQRRRFLTRVRPSPITHSHSDFFNGAMLVVLPLILSFMWITKVIILDPILGSSS